MDNLPSIKEIISKYNISADKKLGQNFLFDQNITDKIVRLAGSLQGKVVFEVGPGPGILTRSILAAGPKKVFSVEADDRCVDALNDYLVPVSDGCFEVIKGDALKFDISSVTSSKVKVIANLPYNISTELLFRWLDKLDNFESFTLMFQREVAQRIMAKPRTKDYGRLSIKTQWLCEVEQGFDLSPESFFPPPKVTSSIINIFPRSEPMFEADKDVLEKLCKTVFNQRRKTLRSSLKQLVGSEAQKMLKSAGIDDSRRPEELSVEEFCVLARCVQSA